MKKITFLLAALLAGVMVNAQDTVTHNNSDVVVDGLGLTCQSGGITTDNAFYGVFDLPGDFGISDDWMVDTVEFGIDEVLNAPGDSYPITINIWTTDGTFPTGTLTLIGGAQFTMTSADALTVKSVDLSGEGIVVPGGSVMVVQMEVQDDTQTGFRLGASDIAANDDSWIQSEPCGLTDPDTYANLGFGDRWHILSVIGDNAVGFDDNIADLVSVYPNPTTDVLNVNVPSSIEINSASLFDVLGKNTGVELVNGQINTSNLARGVYILNVETSAGTLTQKIVKQ